MSASHREFFTETPLPELELLQGRAERTWNVMMGQ